MVKSRTLTLGLKENYSKNMIIYMMVFLFLLSGFLIGVYLFSYLEGDIVVFLKNDFIEYMNTIKDGEFSFFGTLKSSFLSSIVPIVLIIIASTSIIFSPIVLVLLGIKGFTLGFTVSFMLTNFGLKGLLLTVLTLIIHNGLLIFVYVLLCVKSISKSFRRTRFRDKFNFDNSISLRFITFFIIISILISLLFQTLITPLIIKLIF